MTNIRLIPRLDIKGPNLIKGIHLEGLRVVGSPQDYARKYYSQGADELLYMDIVASLYGRNNLSDIVRATAEDIFIPITVGGGIRSIDDARHILRSGADKVAINTAVISRPALITEISEEFGSQCMVLSIEAKKLTDEKWEAYTDNGREKTGYDVIEWVKQGIELGAGEVLITSVDNEGTRKGYDVPLLKAISKFVNVPVIASGGMGAIEHVIEAVKDGGVDAVAMADVLHYDRLTISEIRSSLRQVGMHVREVCQ